MKRCRRCGNTLNKKARFCPNCGTNVPDNSWIAILLIVFGSLIILVVGIILAVFIIVKKTLDNYTDARYVTLDTYNVPNVFHDSDYHVCNFETNQKNVAGHQEITKQFKSCDRFKNRDIDKYVDELYEEGFFEDYDGKRTYYIKEVDDNYIIVVYFYNGDTVVYMYVQDDTDSYKENRNVRV